MEVAVTDDDAGLDHAERRGGRSPTSRATLIGALDRLGAGIHREHEVLAAEPCELLAERAELIVVKRAARQREPLELLDGGGDELRVTVTEVECGIGGQGVEVPSTIDVVDPHAITALDHHRERVVVTGAVVALEHEQRFGMAAPVRHPSVVSPRTESGNRGSPQIEARSTDSASRRRAVRAPYR